MFVPSAPEGLALREVSIQRPANDSPALVKGKPTQLSIESIDLDIDVIDGRYDTVTKEWDLSTDKAHYALMTPEANNQVGNTFIYGHNRNEVFSTLDQTKVGDTALVETENGKIFEYRLRNIKEVAPTDVSLFEYTGDPILTIQTCSGSWYEKRKLFTFEFVEVN